MEKKIGECSTCGGNLTIDHQCGPLYNAKKQDDEIEELKPCPLCKGVAVLLQEDSNRLQYLPRQVICNDCGVTIEGDNCVEIWNTRATDPLIKQLKDEVNRLYVKIDEDRFAALADDSVPKLVFNAAIEAIANKDTLLEEMARALEKARQYIDRSYYYTSHGPTIFNTIDQALQKYREMKDADRMHVDE